MRCLSVDDEPLARRVPERYVRDVGFLELVGRAEDALGAPRLPHEAPVDLLKTCIGPRSPRFDSSRLAR